MKRKPRLAVVVPMYNPGKLIVQVLKHMPKEVDLVVVVDDGSSDGAGELVRNCSDPRIVLLQLEKNSGVGAACKRGMAEAFSRGAGLVVKVDADFQMDPRFVPVIAGPVLAGKADFAKGNRFLHSEELLAMPFVRRLGNMALSFLAKAATGYWQVFDPTNGFFAIHRQVFSLLNQRRIADDYFFEISLLAELRLHGAVVKDVALPASYPHKISHLSVRRALWSFPAKLFRLLCRRVWLEHFVKDFGLVAVSLFFGLFLFFGGGLFGIYHWYYSARAGVVTPTGTVMLAVLPMVFGFQLLLQALFLDVQKIPNTPLQGELPNLGKRGKEVSPNE